MDRGDMDIDSIDDYGNTVLHFLTREIVKTN